MDLYQLRYFLAVVETGNFSRAAERAFVSQPTLSAGIKKLETELGSPLFNRGARSVTLTDTGNRFLPRARTIIYECNAALQEARGKPSARRLRLGVHRFVPGNHLAPLLEDFKKAHPDIQIALKEGTAEQLQALLDENRIDVALTLPAPDGPRTGFERLFSTRCVLLLPLTHPLLSRPYVGLQDLNRLDFVHRSHCPTAAEVTRTFAKKGVNPNIVYRTDENNKALSYVAAGVGLCMAPDILYHPGVTQRPVEGITISRSVGLVTPATQRNELVESFRLFATSHDWHPKRQGSSNLDWAR
ncbi:LysR family transcriptional regulator [Sneathiella chinensis]|uniref:LysR family transcriptional regulator n=1 Tax=Sneathiella chinensis TaxID=349750 RepID=A0ABQ5UAZ5_9PROT|nr:LysR family transcriptional regulator [Sneathiella chinensis]GLQ07736.1 LysR family transcriptional regulator [Sneathiella chinensis]